MATTRHFLRWLASVLDADGLDTTEYVGHIEREFGIRIPNDVTGTLATLGHLNVHIARERRRQARPLSDGEIWERVRRITSEEFGIDAAELHPGIRYVEDLRC